MTPVIFVYFYQGLVVVPCGVITYAGEHALSVSYTNGTLITAKQFKECLRFVLFMAPLVFTTFTR